MDEKDFYEDCDDLENTLDSFKATLNSLREEHDSEDTDEDRKREIERLIHIYTARIDSLYYDNFPEDVD